MEKLTERSFSVEKKLTKKKNKKRFEKVFQKQKIIY